MTLLPDPLTALAVLAALLALAGSAQAIAGWLAARRFVADWPPIRAQRNEPGARPKVTILKPLCGDEPMLEQALASVCAQTYPDFQIVFGVQHATDPAIAVVRRLQARHPACDIALVIDPTAHGGNRKIANLINMLPAASHDILVIADSDIVCPPDWLERVVGTLQIPGTGLATAVYAAFATNNSLAANLGASNITHSFFPGALMARWLGRQDCLGATMALHRATLAKIGGFKALVDHLADDHELGRLIRAENLAIRLADTMVLTTVPEHRLAPLIRHELRWNRTVLAVAPVGFPLSAIQFPLFWAALAIPLAIAGGLGAAWSVALFLASWLVRAACAAGVDAVIARTNNLLLATPAPIWLLPLRDLLSMTTLLASYRSDRVEWRGQVLHTGRTGPATEYEVAPPAPRVVSAG